MATAVATYHGHQESKQERKTSRLRQTGIFFSDLGKDLLSTRRQMQGASKTDLFHNHINALAISYFGLILLLLLGSLPVLAYLIKY